jgi:hypothetical protein
MKKSSFFTVLLTLATVGLMSFTCFQTKAQNSIQYFKLQQVKLLPSDFKSAQQIDLNYMLSLDTDRLLAPYLKAAGLDTLKANYGNWENTGLDGHIEDIICRHCQICMPLQEMLE